MQSTYLSSKQSSSLHLHTLRNDQLLRVDVLCERLLLFKDGCGEGGCNSPRVTIVDGRIPCGIHDAQTS